MCEEIFFIAQMAVEPQGETDRDIQRKAELPQTLNSEVLGSAIQVSLNCKMILS